jgi:hypothetical protein
MESLIDQRYRLVLLESYLRDPMEKNVPGGLSKWIFRCPFCASTARTEGRQSHRKGSLLWDSRQHSWVFSCARRGSAECSSGKTLGNLIAAVDSALGEAYKKDRWHSGTTGKGHNLSSPGRATD